MVKSWLGGRARRGGEWGKEKKKGMMLMFSRFSYEFLTLLFIPASANVISSTTPAITVSVT